MNKTKILIVEDEAIVALSIKMEVQKLDCIVIGMASTEEEVFDIIKNDIPDIILMDINLGENENGIDIINKIKKTQDIPVLYLTAFSDDETMTEAFATNPLGYMVKPFKEQDLKIHIQLAKQKINSLDKHIVNTEYTPLGEDFYFDMKMQHLYFKDQFIKLGKKEQQLLALLVAANYGNVTFVSLEEAIWNGRRISQSALRTLVYRLKGKIGNNIIKVTYGYGYSLNPIT